MSKRDDNNTNRRTLLRSGLAAAGGLLAVPAFASQRYAQEKIAQNLVQYQTSPKDGAKCSLCVNWVDPNSCKIVAGTIVPDGWCVAYAPKSG